MFVIGGYMGTLHSTYHLKNRKPRLRPLDSEAYGIWVCFGLALCLYVVILFH